VSRRPGRHGHKIGERIGIRPEVGQLVNFDRASPPAQQRTGAGTPA
jgi:hypothetical protein